MEKESFEDKEVAAALNKWFVAVKVDREERPDVDHVYMSACLSMNGSGGWPLSVFLTPDKKPFFAGTYFPKDDSPNRWGFLSLLTVIADRWEHHRKRLDKTSEHILSHIQEAVSTEGDIPPKLAREAVHTLMSSYDSRWGGFGRAPKFPSPANLMFLMRAAASEEMDSNIWSAVRHTLSAMAAGGIRDHAGGGFCRYSTDNMWLVPHFEKMLYDNALLCMAYTECFEKTGEFAPVVREIIEYVLCEMSSPSGGYFTAQDADTNGREGVYYCWTPQEVKAVLGESEGERFCLLYDITLSGNFEGMSIPNLIRMPLGGDDLSFASIALKKLLEARRMRVAPMRDEKILLSSNALMAAALAKAGRALENPSYTREAEKCVQFLLGNFRTETGVTALLPSQRTVPATLDGVAYLAWALLEVHQSTLNSLYLDEARSLCGWMIEAFGGENGALYFTAADSNDLPVRGINAHDGATPSGQSVAANCFIRLSRLTGDAYWEVLFEQLLGSLSGSLSRNPEGYPWLLAAVLWQNSGGTDVTLTPGDNLPALRAALRGFEPFMTVRLDEERGGGAATAYVCREQTCLAPVEDASVLKQIIYGGGQRVAAYS